MIPMSTGRRAISALFMVFAIVATCSLLSAQDSSALTNEDVIKLVKAGLPSAVILAKISSSKTDFDTSVDALVALSAEGIPPDVLTAMAEVGTQAPAPAPSPVAPAPPVASVQTGTATIRETSSVAANVRTNFTSGGTATAPTDLYTPDQIGAAMAIGADGGADRLAGACEAGTRQGGLLGRVAGNRYVQSALRERAGRYADRYLSRGLAEFAMRTGEDISPEIIAVINAITEEVAKRKADGTLPPLPKSIRVTGRPPLARVAGHALQLRRLDQPLPKPDSADVAAIIGEDLFEVRVLDYMKGIEFIMIRPRGGDDSKGILPESIKVEDSAMVAQFASGRVKEISEDGNLEVVVVTPSGKFRCNLDDRNIRRGFNPL